MNEEKNNKQTNNIIEKPKQTKKTTTKNKNNQTKSTQKKESTKTSKVKKTSTKVASTKKTSTKKSPKSSKKAENPSYSKKELTNKVAKEKENTIPKEKEALKLVATLPMPEEDKKPVVTEQPEEKTIQPEKEVPEEITVPAKKDTPKKETSEEVNNAKTPLPKTIKSPKAKKEVLKETTNRVSKETITINNDKPKNFKHELKDINNNNEFAKAIFQSDDIPTAIQEEEQNQKKLNQELDELIIKEKKVNFIEPFIFLVVIALCLIGLYLILFTKDSAIISSLLNNINTEITTNLKNINTLKEEINKGMLIDAKIETTNLEYANLKDYQYTFKLSTKDSVYNGNFSLNYNDKTFNTDYTYLDNTLYLKSPAYYYPLKIDNPYSLNPLNINYSNLNNNIEVIKNYLINNLKYSKSTKAKEELNKEKYNVLKINFSKDELNDNLKNLLNIIKNDTELLKSVAKNLGVSEDIIVKYLNKDITFTDDVVLNIYTKGLFQEFSGFTIEEDTNNLVEYFISDKTKSLYLNLDKKINITKSDDKLLVYVDDIKLIDIKYSNNKDETWDFQISNIINNYQGSFVLKNIDATTKQAIFSIKDTNKNDINLEITMNIKQNNDWNAGMDLTDAVSYEDITEEDQENIRNTIYNLMFNDEESSE